jgi:hypothetical protein
MLAQPSSIFFLLRSLPAFFGTRQCQLQFVIRYSLCGICQSMNNIHTNTMLLYSERVLLIILVNRHFSMLRKRVDTPLSIDIGIIFYNMTRNTSVNGDDDDDNNDIIT